MGFGVQPGWPATYEGDVQLWNLDAEELSPTKPVVLQGHSDLVCAVEFNPRGGQLASSSEDHTIILWNLNREGSLESSVRLPGHVDKVVDIAYRHDGRQLASAGLDSTVWLWDVNADDPAASAAVLREFDAPVFAVSYSPDGRFLVTGTRTGHIVAWNLDISELMEEARRIAGRELSSVERNRYLDLPARD